MPKSFFIFFIFVFELVQHIFYQYLNIFNRKNVSLLYLKKNENTSPCCLSFTLFSYYLLIEKLMLIRRKQTYLHFPGPAHC
jgi:hypothetical protein